MWHPMWGWDGGWGWFGLMHLLWWVLLLAGAIVLGAVELARRTFARRAPA